MKHSTSTHHATAEDVVFDDRAVATSKGDRIVRTYRRAQGDNVPPFVPHIEFRTPVDEMEIVGRNQTEAHGEWEPHDQERRT